MFVFRKIWRALFSWNTCFEIRPFALLPTNFRCFFNLTLPMLHFYNPWKQKIFRFFYGFKGYRNVTRGDKWVNKMYYFQVYLRRSFAYKKYTLDDLIILIWWSNNLRFLKNCYHSARKICFLIMSWRLRFISS